MRSTKHQPERPRFDQSDAASIIIWNLKDTYMFIQLKMECVSLGDFHRFSIWR